MIRSTPYSEQGRHEHERIFESRTHGMQTFSVDIPIKCEYIAPLVSSARRVKLDFSQFPGNLCGPEPLDSSDYKKAGLI